MSKLIYSAAIAQLRGEAQEALAMMEYLLSEGAPPMGNTHVEELKAYAKQLVEAEGTMLTLQQYIGPRYQAPATPPPDRSEEVPTVVTPEMSPTLRQSLRAQESKKKRNKKEKE
jgi:hypothetical protein